MTQILGANGQPVPVAATVLTAKIGGSELRFADRAGVPLSPIPVQESQAFLNLAVKQGLDAGVAQNWFSQLFTAVNTNGQYAQSLCREVSTLSARIEALEAEMAVLQDLIPSPE